MLPNLFILGAGKCGTSSLHAILGQHPDIHASEIKEPSFFSWPFQVVQSPIAYFKLFDSPKRYRMESSHVYFSNPETAPVLHALFPDAKFIVTLRNPKARAYSLYRAMRRNKHKDGWPNEEISNFADALKAEDERFGSADFSANCRQYFWNFLYCRSSRYDEQLSRYLDLFSRDQFHISTLADLARDPAAAISSILRFLSLDSAIANTFSFEIKNQWDAYESHDTESDALMNRMLDGVMERTDCVVGRPLDWSL